MSLHYILDGYNIIKQSDFLANKVLKDARMDLVRFISEKKPCGSSNNSVTVVFDGRDDLDYPSGYNKGIEVLFSKHSSADDLIKRLVEKSPNPRRIVVVSNDREIQFFIKAHYAKAEAVEEFIQRGYPKPKKLKDAPKVELSYREAAEIDKELRSLWLRDALGRALQRHP